MLKRSVVRSELFRDYFKGPVPSFPTGVELHNFALEFVARVQQLEDEVKDNFRNLRGLQREILKRQTSWTIPDYR